MAGIKGGLLSCAAGIAILAAVTPASAQNVGAEGAGTSARITVSIPQQDLSDALRQLAEASGLQLIYDTRITGGKTAPAVSGTMTPREALAALLAGSGLSFQFSGDRSAIISAPGGSTTSASDDGVRAVGVVSVEGIGGFTPFGEAASPVNGVNGSRDVQTTEGTGSYTTGAASIVSKVPQTLRETPQSVTVMTSQQIQDQGLVNTRDVLERIAGVTVLNSGNTEDFTFQSRGFEITTFTVDGGASLSGTFNVRPVLDLAQYDSIQLIRGANGTFGGNNDPGGTLNLVRKKPLDHNQTSFEQDVGSFNNFRSELDVTGPATSDGKLRARVVGSHLSRNFFYDVAKAEKYSFYGILEYDLSPTTLVTAGASYVRENNLPNTGGLPRFADGREIDFPVSTCICSPYAYDRRSRVEVFGSVDQAIGSNVTARFNASYSSQKLNALSLNSSSTVISRESARGVLGGYQTFSPLKQLALDFFFNGNFNVLGRRVEIVLGGNYVNRDNSGGFVAFVDNVEIPNIFEFNPYALARPTVEAIPTAQTLRNDFNEYGAYASIKIEILKNLNISTAMRYTEYSDQSTALYSYSPDLQISPVLRERNLSRPNVGVTFDFLRNFTLYGSYQATYQPQQMARFTTGVFAPPPVVGVNLEGGVKWESPNGRLNASLAYYRITQNGFLTTDFNRPTENIPALQDIKSQGVDFELAGELARGLQVSIGYSYNNNELTQNSFKRPNSSYTPHHVIKSWVTYRLPEESALKGLILGGGVKWQTDAFERGFLCQDPPSTDPNAGCSGFRPFAFTTPGYGTVDLKVGYQLSKNVELSLIGRNVADVRTYGVTPSQNIAGFNSYIEPRNFLGQLNMRW